MRERPRSDIERGEGEIGERGREENAMNPKCQLKEILNKYGCVWSGIVPASRCNNVNSPS